MLVARFRTHPQDPVLLLHDGNSLQLHEGHASPQICATFSVHWGSGLIEEVLLEVKVSSSAVVFELSGHHAELIKLFVVVASSGGIFRVEVPSVSSIHPAGWRMTAPAFEFSAYRLAATRVLGQRKQSVATRCIRCVVCAAYANHAKKDLVLLEKGA